MAGIGFAMRRLLAQGTIGGALQAYGLACLIGTGPWVLSIVAILAIGLIGAGNRGGNLFVAQFQVSVTYLMAASLLWTSLLQLSFTRFVSDRLFAGEHAVIPSNLLGALVVVMLSAGLIGSSVLLAWVPGSVIYLSCMLAGFVLLCGTWIVVSYAAACKAHGTILLGFLVGYGATTSAALGLSRFGLDGLMAGFVTGQALLFFILLSLVLHPSGDHALLSFSFLHKDKRYPSLVATGSLFTLGVWVDKFVFWTNRYTGVEVVGSLRASPIYDLPIFLAYLSLVPGMAVLFYRIESDFAPACEMFYKAIREGATYAVITEAKKKMVSSIRQCLLALVKVQGTTTLLLLLMGDDLLDWFGISQTHRTLLNVNLVSAALQLLLLMIFNVLFYLDKRQAVLRLALLLAGSNLFLSLVTLQMGVEYYGFGFAASMVLTSGVGMFVLSHTLDRLEYATFMLQPVG